MVYYFTNTNDHLDYSNVVKQGNSSGYRSFLQFWFSHSATRLREEKRIRPLVYIISMRHSFCLDSYIIPIMLLGVAWILGKFE
jgi:hypothetical protein